MPVTLTDEQAAQLRQHLEAGHQARQIAEGVTQIWNDPQLSNDAKALWKRKFPDGRIPEYDTEQRLNARLDKMEKDREDREREMREREERDKDARDRAAVQQKYKFTDEGMVELDKLRQDRLVADYEVAASYLASQKPSPSEGGSEYDRHFWQHDRQPQYKEIAADPEGFARREIMNTLTSMKRGRF